MTVKRTGEVLEMEIAPILHIRQYSTKTYPAATLRDLLHERDGLRAMHDI